MRFDSNVLRTLFLALSLGATACSEERPVASDVLVTSVDHTAVKRQSIGNCWIYAQTTWLESLIYDDSGEKLDISESYWTWWHWYGQLVGAGSIKEIQTGGFWSVSNDIVLKRGWVLEAEFIEDEAGVEMSVAQADALAYINQQLKAGGKLATAQDRTAAKVRAELDKAFGVSMADAELVARKAADTIVDHTATGAPVTLQAALKGDTAARWKQVSFPRVFGEGTTPTASQLAARKTLFRRVMKALNDHQPVVMTLMIDFNALDITDQTFKASLQEQNGAGKQGGHMVVLNDYVVDNAPGYGTIGEGDVSDEMKTAALDGDLVLFKAKNSWGTNRPERGLTDGYTRFDYDYLTKQLEWTSDFGSDFYTTLTDFVLPPGY